MARRNTSRPADEAATEPAAAPLEDAVDTSTGGTTAEPASTPDAADNASLPGDAAATEPNVARRAAAKPKITTPNATEPDLEAAPGERLSPRGRIAVRLIASLLMTGHYSRAIFKADDSARIISAAYDMAGLILERDAAGTPHD